MRIGLGLIPNNELGQNIIVGLDAVLLIIWLVHEQVEHKIRDYI